MILENILTYGVAESPRLAWLRANDLTTREYQHAHSLNGAHRWVCCNRAQTRYASGNTEQEAELAWAARYEVTHYAIREWQTATGGFVGETALVMARTAAVTPSTPVELPISALEGWE